MEQLALHLRRLVRGKETEAGRRWHAKSEQDRSAHALARRQEFLSQTRCDRDAGRLIVGRAQDFSGVLPADSRSLRAAPQASSKRGAS